MVLLTGAVTFGMLSSVRFARPGWPRFLTSGLHRNLSLLALTFTVVHVITTVLDTYTSIGISAAVVPFSSDYRRLWLGLGTIAFDLMLAVIVTSLLRARIGYRAWRAVHWASYVCWPVAIVHGLGTGTDGARGWVLALAAACVGVVLLAGAWRLAYGWPARAGARLGAAAAALVVLVAAIGWLRAGPMRPGWARRSGTPVALLAGVATGGAAAGRSEALPAVPFHTAVRGTLTVDIARTASGVTGTLSVSPGGGFSAEDGSGG